jgi:pimeloyl-ACP methyl ester carboxylesterase
MISRGLVAAAVAVVSLAVASPVLGTPARASSGAVDAIDWRRCTKAEMPTDPDVRARMQCAEVEVPVDHDDPDGRTITLFVSRRPSTAPDPLGPLFVNQGGPGKEAAVYAASMSAYPAFDRFDIIGMDPRGVGRSTALECSTDIRDVPPFAPPGEGRAARRYARGVERFVAGCADDPNLPFLGSNNAARDMDTIRARLGAEQLTYFGKSYGSDLGAAYATLFPTRVRAAILDGGTDFTIDPVDFVIAQAAAGQRALERYLEHCRSSACAWTEGDDPRVAWDRLVAAADEEPIRGDDGSVDGATLRDFGAALFGLEPAQATALLDALVLERDPSALIDEPPTDEDAKDAAAFLAVTCLDLPVDDFEAAATRLFDAVPGTGPNEASVLALCAAWPKPADPIVPKTGVDRGPMAVVSTVGDVPTPYESGVALARSLGVPLITWDADAHTAYLFSPCVQAVADALLVDLVPVPAEGVTCPDDRTRELPPDGIDPDEPLEPDLTP